MLGLVRSGAREIDTTRPSSRPRWPRKVLQLLTSAERELAELVSTGLTNKQIAATLYCSPYTVDSHLRAIYRKFGLTSRAALASHMARLNETAQARQET